MVEEKKFITGEFPARDGVRLSYRRSAKQSKNKILIFHGLMEYSAEYSEIMDRIFPGDNDVEWAAMDMRGHGRSEGIRGEIDLEKCQEDCEDFIGCLGWGEGSFVGLAHSFGGLLALLLAGRKKSFFKALLLSSPFLGFPEKRLLVKLVGCSLLSLFFPDFKVQHPVNISKLTHNTQVVNRRLSDPFVWGSITFRSLKKIKKAQDNLLQNCHLDFPMLLLMSGDELVVGAGATNRWFECLECDNKRRVEFKNLYHEIFNESENETVILEAGKFLKGVFDGNIR